MLLGGCTQRSHVKPNVSSDCCTLRSGVSDPGALNEFHTRDEKERDHGGESLFGLPQPRLHGRCLDSFFNVLWFRPQLKAAELEKTYFVGASTHPGTGVPIVLAGAKLTAEQILRDMGMPVPWDGRRGSEQGVRDRRLDKKAMDGFRFGTEEFLTLLVIVMALLVSVYLLPSVSVLARS